VAATQTDLPLVGNDGYGMTTTRNNVLVTGQVALNTTAALPPGFVSPSSWGATVLHEVGHAMNLAHVSDPDQIMYPTGNGRRTSGLGAGDLTGLRFLGSGGCIVLPPL
jgi:predicted Zn-dependent protease